MSGRYRMHLGVYTKLVRGRDLTNPVVYGEAAIRAHSAGFPREYRALCHPSTFFEGDPDIVSIDPKTVAGGVFVYQPVFLGQTPLSLFARLEARSEEGEGNIGRQYMHCAVLIVEDAWQPELAIAAASILFDEVHGRCAGGGVTEEDELRRELPLPDFDRESLNALGENFNPSALDLAPDEAGKRRLRCDMPADSDETHHPYMQAGIAIAHELQANGLAINGRWLSFACGLSAEIEGKAVDFAIRLRANTGPTGEREMPKDRVKLHFDDSSEPRVEPHYADDGRIGHVNWRQLGRKSHGYSNGRLATEHFPPDQHEDVWDVPASVQDSVNEALFDFEDEGDFVFQTIHDMVREGVSHDGSVGSALVEAEMLPQFSRPELAAHVNDDRLQVIGAGFEGFQDRLRVIRSPMFDYPSHDKADETIARCLVAFLLYGLIGCLKESRETLQERIAPLLAHPALPRLSIAQSSQKGSILAGMLWDVIEPFDVQHLQTWILAISEVERTASRHHASMQLRDLPLIRRDVSEMRAWLNGFHRQPAPHQATTADVEIWAITRDRIVANAVTKFSLVLGEDDSGVLDLPARMP